MNNITTKSQNKKMQKNCPQYSIAILAGISSFSKKSNSMKKYILAVFTIAFIVFQVDAQNIKRGFKSLEKPEYDKAKDAFEKVLQSDSNSVAANFGMGLVLADDKSPLFDIIKSWYYIKKVSGRENELSQEEIEILGEYFLNTEVRKTSRPVKKKVEIAVEAIEARLIKYIREENNLEACYRVLNLYPDFKHYDNVVHIRNQFEFRKYEKINTLAAYEEFIQKFPDAAQTPKALKYCNKLAFEEAKTSNTVLSYNKYIEKYPASHYLQQAIKMRNAAAFNDARKQNTLEAYGQFIAFYPDALEIPEAKKQQHQLMYEKAKRIKTLEAYNEFIRLYPDGVYYVDIFNLKSSDLGMQEYKKLGFDSPDFIWARALDFDKSVDLASSFINTPDSGFVVAGTTAKSDTSYSDAWVIRLDKRGNMIWNKTIGQQYNEKVKQVLINSRGEIIVTGYTQVLSDSSAFVGWMFKLGPDGNRIWNKNLGNVRISASSIGLGDKIYLSLSDAHDTLPKFHLVAYNSDGNIIWDKDYVQQGNFKNIMFNGPDKFFLAGSKWITLNDEKFYIKWEDTLSYNAQSKIASSNERYIVFTAENEQSNYVELRGIDGNRLWFKTFAKTDNADVFKAILINSQNEIVISGKNMQGPYLLKLDSKGEKIAEKRFYSSSFEPIEIIKTYQGIAYLFRGQDYFISCFSSWGF